MFIECNTGLSDWDFWLAFKCTAGAVNFSGNIVLFMGGMSCIGLHASMFVKFLILIVLDLNVVFFRMTKDIFACPHT